MALMFALGLFGFRPGQMIKLGNITNFTLILNFLLILCIGTGFLFTTDFQSKISNKFLVLFHIFLSMELAALCYICYKKYNLFSLLQDIRKVRSQCLSKRELFFICVIFIAIITSIGGIFYFSMVIVHDIFKTGKSQQWKVSIVPTDNYTAVKILAFIELIVISISWSSVLITSFMVIVIVMVVRREFENCIEKLQKTIETCASLSQEVFSEFTERFYQLKGVLEAVDSMFSTTIGLNISLSILTLCGAVYAYMVHDGDLKVWILFIIVSVVTVFTLLLPLASLHNKVTYFTFIVLISTRDTIICMVQQYFYFFRLIVLLEY